MSVVRHPLFREVSLTIGAAIVSFFVVGRPSDNMKLPSRETTLVRHTSLHIQVERRAKVIEGHVIFARPLYFHRQTHTLRDECGLIDILIRQPAPKTATTANRVDCHSLGRE
jgi:hypothetical protein